MTLWDWLLWFFWIYIFIAYLMILFQIFGDIFRDHDLNGWLKALWIIFLIVAPFLGALIYLVVRGRSMGERSMAKMRSMQADQDAYIRATAGSGASAADEIAKARDLLQSGAISQADYDRLKAKALG
ncbi:hypothetical protein JOD63_003107 [Microbacterium terrae]|uniref:SHOCT domain-containing protein n=1 Tax=Microbacterium terrae TaxID=69369 RepID=A0A0M2H7H5_9MICO|nr:SHOCT domain-containing protein [Microbacterium terrae]KJL40536.1 hypothetical protein RS81_01620 [Microbacterium terrae]MBP1079139.1 hypothetical protein [Microbacterium terrae]GLJ98540.1 membrane protein [Microbacterium terrae]